MHKVAKSAIQRFKHYADVSTKVDIRRNPFCGSSRNLCRRDIALPGGRHGDDADEGDKGDECYFFFA